MKTIRLTMAQALVRCSDRPAHRDRRQRSAAVRRRLRHLRPRQRHLPRRGARARSRTSCRPGAARTSSRWRWPRVAYAKAKRRRQIMIATSFDRPGLHQHGHRRRRRACQPAAGPVPARGDTFATASPTRCCSRSSTSTIRRSPSTTPSRPVTRYWDRITRPEQIIASLPQARGRHARSRRLRPGLHRPRPGRPGRGVRLPASPSSRRGSTASRDPGPTSSSSSRPRSAAAQGEEAADHRRRRRPLLRRRAELAAFAERHRIPVVETIAGSSVLAPRPPAQRRPDRRHRLGRRQRDRRRGRRRARRRHAAAGLHHRLVDAVPDPGRALRLAQRRPLRRQQAPRGRRSSATPSCRHRATSRSGLAGWSRARRLGRARRANEDADWNAVVDQRSARDQRRAADLRPGDRRDQRHAATDATHRCRPPAACRASSTSAGRRRASAPSTASSASPAWATRSPAAGAPRWPTRPRGHRLRRRRLLPDDELRHLLVGADRPQADLSSSATMAASRSSTGCRSSRAARRSTTCSGLRASSARSEVDFAKHAESMGAIGRARVRSATSRTRSRAPRRPTAPT